MTSEMTVESGYDQKYEYETIGVHFKLFDCIVVYQYLQLINAGA